MDYQNITYVVDRGVAVIKLSRPEKLNAYTPDMGEEVVHAYRRGVEQSDVRALVLTGEGRGFCAGADRDFLQGKVANCGKRLGEEHFISGFAAEIASSPKLMIAAVNGVASGVGATMTLPFDLRIASDQARFDFPFVRLGVVPGFGSSYFLPRLIGAGSADDVLLNSRCLSADTAQKLGLVQQIVPAAQLLDTAIAMARSISAAPGSIVSQSKQLLRDSFGSSLVECMEREQQASREFTAYFSASSH
ncbi:enoyl-CoA hydratase/isomerase family protein [Spongiibacter marinus]|uniref:enoyl-CoA hydratase/isomerase family protein n=1 Tax=Spongiibacter marinus TaxID=354246 RepID=UPI0019611C73|nr:enoyl-CoA hydratase-related protein [Spongiibacter marinus]MBM7422956.1 2-(1,2-epoxy-1,2-dihydrophenyl)acetyl-CoA isomerase [Spongiibacter marinus]